MPFEMLPCRPVGRIGRQGDLSVFQACEQEGGIAGFGDVAVGEKDGVVVAGDQRPIANSQWAFLERAMPLFRSLLRLRANWWIWMTKAGA